MQRQNTILALPLSPASHKTPNTKATYSLYRYNPYIEEVQGGGGFYLFEQLWQQYQF
jgi:hypothetical protein